MAADPTAGERLVERLGALVGTLRQAGIDVTTGAHIDAAAALTHLPLDDLPAVRAGLRAALVKESDPDGVFDRAFDRVMLDRRSLGTSDADAGSSAPGTTTAADHGLDTPMGGLNDLVADALRRGDHDDLVALAARAVDAFGGMDEAMTSDRYHLHRTLRALDLSNMLGAAMRRLRADGELTELELSLARSELSRMLEEFRRAVAEQIALRRLSREDRPTPDDPAGAPERADLRDRAVLELSAVELAELRRLVQPLARRLAARIARHRRPRGTGRLDVRRTIRRSLDTGGVPLDVAQRRRHPHRPDLVVLCDVSGSVAPFAQFIFMLVNALHTELRAVRSFAFVDGVAEVSDLFQTAVHDLRVNRLVERRGVVGLDGHSDYGQVFGEFVDRHLDAVTRRTTVIVCGDARGNYRPSGREALAQIAERARRVYWLNPEPRHEWDETDSLVEEYRPSCDAVLEVRTLRQLADAIAAII